MDTQAGNCCDYCQSHQDYLGWTLETDHIIPLAKGGSDAEDNLWMACHTCNLHKGVRTRANDPLTGRSVQLFNPRHQQWSRHFYWSEDGTRIVGRTARGRAKVVTLNLNNLLAVTVRRNWVSADWHPSD